jgi:hypothetical protein
MPEKANPTAPDYDSSMNALQKWVMMDTPDRNMHTLPGPIVLPYEWNTRDIAGRLAGASIKQVYGQDELGHSTSLLDQLRRRIEGGNLENPEAQAGVPQEDIQKARDQMRAEHGDPSKEVGPLGWQFIKGMPHFFAGLYDTATDIMSPSDVSGRLAVNPKDKAYYEQGKLANSPLLSWSKDAEDRMGELEQKAKSTYAMSPAKTLMQHGAEAVQPLLGVPGIGEEGAFGETLAQLKGMLSIAKPEDWARMSAEFSGFGGVGSWWDQKKQELQDLGRQWYKDHPKPPQQQAQEQHAGGGVVGYARGGEAGILERLMQEFKELSESASDYQGEMSKPTREDLFTKSLQVHDTASRPNPTARDLGELRENINAYKDASLPYRTGPIMPQVPRQMTPEELALLNRVRYSPPWDLPASYQPGGNLVNPRGQVSPEYFERYGLPSPYGKLPAASPRPDVDLTGIFPPDLDVTKTPPEGGKAAGGEVAHEINLGNILDNLRTRLPRFSMSEGGEPPSPKRVSRRGFLGALGAMGASVPLILKELESGLSKAPEAAEASHVAAPAASHPPPMQFTPEQHAAANAELAAERGARYYTPETLAANRALIDNHLVRSPTSLEIPESQVLLHTREHGERLADQGSYFGNLEGDLPSDFMPQIHETTPQFDQFMASQGMAHDIERGVYHFDPERAHNIVNEGSMLYKEIDQKIHPSESIAEKYGIHSDDAFDYNGGYTSAGAEQLYDVARPGHEMHIPEDPRRARFDLMSAINQAHDHVWDIHGRNEYDLPGMGNAREALKEIPGGERGLPLLDQIERMYGNNTVMDSEYNRGRGLEIWHNPYPHPDAPQALAEYDQFLDRLSRANGVPPPVREYRMIGPNQIYNLRTETLRSRPTPEVGPGENPEAVPPAEAPHAETPPPEEGFLTGMENLGKGVELKAQEMGKGLEDEINQLIDKISKLKD